jgi:ABC-2 type transport system permease protein
MNGFTTRLLALTRKEFRQLVRDSSNLAIGVFLPMILILLFGYGLSLDVKDAPIAVVMEDASPTAQEAVAGLRLSRAFAPVMLASMHDAEELMRKREVDAIVRVPSDFTRRKAAGQGRIQLLAHGADAGRANIIINYVQSALAQPAGRNDRARGTGIGAVVIEERMWYNSANTSTWYLVPGLIVLVMTLVGAFLTALVMAREWERGTLEALFVTPVRPVEILLAKIIPYFTVGMLGLTLCLLASRYLFGVISSVTKNQFLASQVALLSTFMPSLMLSGFLFDLRNVPLVVRLVGHVLPATYFMDLIRTLFLAGDVWPVVLKDCGLLAMYAVLLLMLARFVTRKQLD